MLGWEFFVTLRRQSGDEKVDVRTPVARWIAGLDGIDWIKKFARDGQAFEVETHNDSFQWLVKAGVLRHAISSGLKPSVPKVVFADDYVQPGGWSRFKMINRELLASLDQEEVLLVEVWDQS